MKIVNNTDNLQNIKFKMRGLDHRLRQMKHFLFGLMCSGEANISCQFDVTVWNDALT